MRATEPRLTDPRLVRRGALAGVAGGLAYLLAHQLDEDPDNRRYDDRVFLGRPFASNLHRARRLGLAIHAANSIALGVVYAVVAEPRLAGSGLWRGLAFANLENALLYPLTALDRLHPAVRDGQLDRYWSWPALARSIDRHVAYGAALGVVYERLNRRAARRRD
jgi:hypothetical protein